MPTLPGELPKDGQFHTMQVFTPVGIKDIPAGDFDTAEYKVVVFKDKVHFAFADNPTVTFPLPACTCLGIDDHVNKLRIDIATTVMYM